MRLWIIPGLSALLLAACASAPKSPPAVGTQQPKSPPAVGTQQLQDETSVWKEFECEKKNLPFLALESNQISPSTLRSGEEFRHGFVYALCPVTPAKPIQVKLSRTITRQGKTQVYDADNDYRLKPGRWIVNALITVPLDARSGAYNLRISLTNPNVSVGGVVPFVVQRQ